MKIIETSIIGESVIKKHGCILIGLSIKNSYFKNENLKKILEWVSNNSNKSYIMIPDKPAIYTLMSLGYEKSKAQTKAGLEANRLENKCNKIINDNKLSNISIIRWRNIENNKEYLDSLEKIQSFYSSDNNFNQSIKNTTQEVIEKNKNSLEMSKALDIGVNFLFQELAFISNSANILKQEQVAYFYHKTIPVFKNMLENKYTINISNNVGFITAS